MIVMSHNEVKHNLGDFKNSGMLLGLLVLM